MVDTWGFNFLKIFVINWFKHILQVGGQTLFTPPSPKEIGKKLQNWKIMAQRWDFCALWRQVLVVQPMVLFSSNMLIIFFSVFEHFSLNYLEWVSFSRKHWVGFFKKMTCRPNLPKTFIIAEKCWKMTEKKVKAAKKICDTYEPLRTRVG